MQQEEDIAYTETTKAQENQWNYLLNTQHLQPDDTFHSLFHVGQFAFREDNGEQCKRDHVRRLDGTASPPRIWHSSRRVRGSISGRDSKTKQAMASEQSPGVAFSMERKNLEQTCVGSVNRLYRDLNFRRVAPNEIFCFPF